MYNSVIVLMLALRLPTLDLEWVILLAFVLRKVVSGNRLVTCSNPESIVQK